MKRVWTLYRVSTRQQVNTDDDIPMQKTSCHNFAKRQGDWEITNELFERGVSGWSKSADERDALNTIRAAAVKNEFDILLVFMFDRLGRRDDETPFVINFLHQNNVEVWSVQEGKRRMDSHTDKLINYISSWQSSGESIKTSLRVRESKKQLSEQGYYQGGVTPYGYELIDTDQSHWKDKERQIKELVPNEYESNIVKLMFDLYVDKHYGYRKIADYLSENGYKNRKGKAFGISTIQRLLDNTIYVGRKRYKSFEGKEGDTQPYNEKLRIVSDEVFRKVQEIKNKRKSSLNEQDKTGIPLSGKLLFSGLAYCKYCGSKLSGNYLYRQNQKPHNRSEYYTNTVYRYRCPLNKGKLAIPHGKNIWGAKKFDTLTIESVKEVIGLINIKQFIKTNVDKKQVRLSVKEESVKNLQKEKVNTNKQLEKLNSEIALSLLGQSSFTPDQLSNAINSLKEKLETIETQIESVSEELSNEKNNYTDVKILADELTDWEEKFDNADDDLKKAMLSRIIDKVYFEANDVTIEFNFMLEEVLKAILGEIGSA